MKAGLFSLRAPLRVASIQKELHMENQIEELKMLFETLADLIALIKRKQPPKTWGKKVGWCSGSMWALRG